MDPTAALQDEKQKSRYVAGGRKMTDGIRDALGMDAKNKTIRNLAESRQRERSRAEQVEQERDRLREERDRYQELLQRVIEEWDYRGKHKYRDGAPAIIFDIRAELENEE